MLNLLAFKNRAGDHPDKEAEGSSGAEAYMLYAEKMKKFVESKGARFLWTGKVDSMVIGESDVEFQMVGLVEYPSRKAFIEIATSGHVAEIGKDRGRGLEGQWLIACTGSSFD